MANKWDGFSAFDSEKWDMKYQRGEYAPDPTQPRALKIVAVGLVAILGCLLWGKFGSPTNYNQRVYYGEEHSSRQPPRREQRYFKDEEAPRSRRYYRTRDVLR